MQISPNAQQLSTWLQGHNASGTTAKKDDLKHAAKDLGLTVPQVQAARLELVDVAAHNNAQRGQAAKAGVASAGVAVDFGGARTNQVKARGDKHSDPKIKAFEQSTYTLLDVEQVMKKANLKTPDAAKKFIGERILGNREAELSAMGVHSDNYDSYELRDAFKRSAYSENDAQAALKAFGFLSNIEDAREYIGLKIVNGPQYEKDILAPMGITPQPFDHQDLMGAFARSTYSDADVRTARKSFDFLANVSDVEIKEYIGLKIVNHYEAMLGEKGITQNPFDKQDCLNAFSTSHYSSADVAAAKMAFEFLANTSTEGVKEYIGLKIVNGYEQMLAEKGITQNPWDDQDCLKAFNASGYDTADVKAARDQLPFLKDSTDTDVKAYIGLKIVNKYEQMLSDVGIVPTDGKKAHREPHIVSQQEMNAHAFKKLEKSEQRLTDATKELRKGLEPEDQKDLAAAVDAFKAYAQAEGVLQGNLMARGGSMEPMIEAGTQDGLVKQFAKEIERAATNGFAYRGTAKMEATDPQQEMNRKAYEAFNFADTQMKTTFDRLQPFVDDDSLKELKTSQAAFETFRDAQATLAGNMEARGGSLFGLINACALEALTTQRQKLLDAMLEAVRGE